MSKKEFVCPIDENCKHIKPDGTCNGNCFGKIASIARKNDREISNPKIEGSSESGRDRIQKD